jgi:hypothetical protein
VHDASACNNYNISAIRQRVRITETCGRFGAFALWLFNQVLKNCDLAQINDASHGIKPETDPHERLSRHCCWYRESTGIFECDSLLVPEARLELASLAAEDFESPASTIPPLGPPGLGLGKTAPVVNVVRAKVRRC